MNLSAQNKETIVNFIGNIFASDSWKDGSEEYGIYSFTSSSSSFTPLVTGDDIVANAGSALSNGKYYFVNLINDWGINWCTLYTYDATTWKLLNEDYDVDSRMIAFETAQALDGTVYGEFSDDDETGMEIGKVNYETKSRTTIAKTSRHFVAMGVSSTDKLYGIDDNGDLYNIDTHDGSETLIGSTGLVLSNNGSSPYPQSGEIDQNSDTFYWACTTSDKKSALYEVDLTTAKATKLYNFPDNQQIYGMLIPHSLAKAGAPAKVTNLDLDFYEGSTTGSISFTAPTTTFSGNNLTGNLAYTITANDSTIAEGNVQPGEDKTTEVTVNSGENTIKVYTTNEEGISPKVDTTLWIGYDEPADISKVTAENTGNGINVSWAKSEGSKHGGYTGNITYDVMRLPDSLVIGSDLSSTSITDNNISGTVRGYSYTVTPKNGTVKGKATTSNKIVVGDAIIPPYKNTFDDQQSINAFTIIDANNDGKTWEWNGWNGGHLRATYSYDIAANDWILTPAFHLSGGRSYTFTFDAMRAGENDSESMEVLWGKGYDYTQYQDTLFSRKNEIPYSSDGIYSRFNYEVTPATDGDYTFGFHSLSPANQYFIYVDNISLLPNALPESPDTVTGLNIVRGRYGELEAQIDFNVPSKSIDGNTLQNIDSLVVECNDKTIYSVQSPNPGQRVSFKQTPNLTSGYNNYNIVAYNSFGVGKERKDTVWVGSDIPTEPDSIVLSDAIDHLNLSWKSVDSIGTHGYYVNTDSVAYSITNINSSGQPLIPHIEDNVKGNNFSIQQNPDEGDAKLLQLAIRATNQSGQSLWALSSPLVIGEPATLPFAESFAGTKVQSGFLWLQRDSTTERNWEMQNVSSDGDEGSALWVSQTLGETASLNFRKLNIEGTQNPRLTFNYMGSGTGQIELSTVALLPDGSEDELKNVTVNHDDGWKRVAVDLSPLKSYRYFVLRLKAKNISTSFASVVCVDDIEINDAPESAVEVTSSAPQSVTRGTDVPVNVKVTNKGTDPINSFELVMTKDGTVVVDSLLNTNIQFNETKDFTISIPTLASDGEAIAIIAKVSPNGTQIETSSPAINVALYQKDVPQVNDLKAYRNGTAVDLSWKTPDNEAKSVVEDFESYTPWATAFGDWTLYDNNNEPAGHISGLNYGSEGERFAFTIFNYDSLQTTDHQYVAHSGSQYAAVPFETDDVLTFYDGDNWLVSPRLSGNAQDISFWVHNLLIYSDDGSVYTSPETFDILYSKTDKNIASFTKIGDTQTISSGLWTKYTIHLDEGTSFFAIHQNSDRNTSYLFGIDDISYEAGNGNVVAYNIYRDGKLVGTVSADALTFTDNPSEGQHEYSVTVVYEDGIESAPVTADITTGITIPEITNTKEMSVYGLDGKYYGKSNNIDKLQSGVYIINGKKIIIK